MSAPGALEFVVPHPTDKFCVWKVRYYESSGRSWWTRCYINSFGHITPATTFVPPAPDPWRVDDDELDE